MTREEAIEIIEIYASELKQRAKDGYVCLEEKDVYLYQLQAFDMAIEALHREEAEEKGYCHRIRPKGERKEPLPQYEEWQGEFNKMCESARPSGADMRGEEE